MQFHWYGLIVGIAIAVGWSWAEKMEPKVGKIAPWAIMGGLIGARIWHVATMWEHYRENIGQILMVWNGGMSIWGGILGGMLGMEIRIKNSEFRMEDRWQILSAIAIAMPLSQAIGRIANGVNREFTNKVLGIEWWGMEAMLDLILLSILWILPKKYRVLGYLIGYGLIRLVLQPYRSVE